MAKFDKYDGLTRLQWANRVVEYNDKFDKSALIKHYTAQQLGKFQEGGKIQLTKAVKDKIKTNTTPAKKTIVKTPGAPARSGKALEIEKFLRQVAHENGIKINFDPPPTGPPQLVRQMSLLPIGRVAACPGGGCKKPAPKGDDDVYSDDSDLESCDDED